ncbi:hypothetical protein ACFL2O_06740 [Thermodesulfobacteriota bacterium]
MAEQLIEIVKIENGLELEIWDLSRMIAGDRWLVCVEIRIDVPILPEHLELLKKSDNACSILKNEYGTKVPYRYNQVKHFVAENEKEDVFRKFVETVKGDLYNYISHPDFAKKYLALTYKRLRTQKPQLFQ